MSDSNTIRILELDGGGERGYLSLKFLEKIIQQWGINPAKIAENFDVICGTSIGGIIAVGLGLGLTPAQISPFFTVQGPYIFSLISFVPSVRPNPVIKLALLLANTPFYKSSAPNADQYGSGLLYKTIQDLCGTHTLQDLKTNILIPTFESINKNFVLCSNLNYPGLMGQNELASNVALATSAAPVYLPSLDLRMNTGVGKLQGIFLDGGVYQNNPASLGLTLGKILKPNATRACVLSLGTGSGSYGFDNDPAVFMDNFKREVLNYPTDTTFRMVLEQVAPSEVLLRNINNKILDIKIVDTEFSTLSLLFELFSIASAGAQESVAQDLFLESSYTLDQLYYYRFQPKLNLLLDPSLDNTDEILIGNGSTIPGYYEDLANTTFNNDIENISTFLGHLTA